MIHAFVYSWPRVIDNVPQLCRELAGCVDELTIIDICTGPIPDSPGHWLRVDPNFYFGRQFEVAINECRGDIYLGIVGDASHPNWREVIDLCRARFVRFPNLGVWAPDVDFTWHDTDWVGLAQLDDPNMVVVVQTDSVVWALNRPVIEFMRTLNYSGDDIGWGIDWAAICYAFANRLLVVRDLTTRVIHPRGSGYVHEDARRQMQWFLSQLGQVETLQYKLLDAYWWRKFSQDHQLAELTNQRDGVLAELNTLKNRHDAVLGQLSAAKNHHDATLGELNALKNQHEETLGELNTLRNQHEFALTELSAIYQSTSWKMIQVVGRLLAPFRRI